MVQSVAMFRSHVAVQCLEYFIVFVMEGASKERKKIGVNGNDEVRRVINLNEAKTVTS